MPRRRTGEGGEEAGEEEGIDGRGDEGGMDEEVGGREGRMEDSGRRRRKKKVLVEEKKQGRRSRTMQE